MEKLTAEQLLAVLKEANEQLHPAQQAYISETVYGLDEVVLDGKFNLRLIAEMLNKVHA